jgi:hypothetical protein
MGSRHPSNGPSLSKATYKASRPGPAPSPERQRAEVELAATDAAKQRRFLQLMHNDPDAWFKEYFKK